MLGGEELFRSKELKTAEEREEITEKWEAGEYETPHFKSYVYAITGSSTVNPFTIEIYTAEQTYAIQDIELFRDSTMANYIVDKSNAQFVYTPGTENYPMNVY